LTPLSAFYFLSIRLRVGQDRPCPKACQWGRTHCRIREDECNWCRFANSCGAFD